MRRLPPLLVLLAACGATPPSEGPTCVSGLDHDADGVCDREAADWSSSATVPEGGRANIYDLPPEVLAEVRDEGLRHAAVWPVEVSGVLLPYGALTRFFEGDGEGSGALTQLARTTLGFGTLDEMYAWLGLAPFSPADAEGPFRTPLPPGMQAGDPVGVGAVPTEHGDGLTFSCATCHVAEFFGHTVVGMTNRRARANEFFRLGQRFFPDVPADLFQQLTDADEGEMVLFARAQEALPAIGAVEPKVTGLDTSLAQVALSLSKRTEDAYATRDPALEASPRPNALEAFVADSKPMVWWTMKHKTRWLAEGSIVQGNPVFTNFLWNELGRGTDLVELETWLQDNQRIVDELTVAVFASEAPRWHQIFPDHPIDLDAAQRGQALFGDHCAECHGTYDKGWDADDAASRDADALTETTAVTYHPATPVFDVGTDGQRGVGMTHFADRLNDLAISQWMQTVVEPQVGYVPPPLDGIFARYPYLHNQSVPSLCALLSPEEERPEVFWMGPADDAATDYDFDCVGFPVGDAMPEAWAEAEASRYDTTQPGLSNQGHTSMLTDADGDWLLSADDRADLIAFLKTL